MQPMGVCNIAIFKKVFNSATFNYYCRYYYFIGNVANLIFFYLLCRWCAMIKIFIYLCFQKNLHNILTQTWRKHIDVFFIKVVMQKKYRYLKAHVVLFNFNEDPLTNILNFEYKVFFLVTMFFIIMWLCKKVKSHANDRR